MTKDILSLLNSPFFVGFDRIHDRLHEFNDTLSKNVPSSVFVTNGQMKTRFILLHGMKTKTTKQC